MIYGSKVFRSYWNDLQSFRILDRKRNVKTRGCHESIHEHLPTKHLEVECGHALAQGFKTLTLRHGRVDTDESILSACQYGRLPCDNTSDVGICRCNFYQNGTKARARRWWCETDILLRMAQASSDEDGDNCCCDGLRKTTSYFSMPRSFLQKKSLVPALHGWNGLNQNQPLGPPPLPRVDSWQLQAGRKSQANPWHPKRAPGCLDLFFWWICLVSYHGKYHHVKPSIWEVFFSFFQAPKQANLSV